MILFGFMQIVDEKLYAELKQQADKLFVGTKDSVKNLWIQREYRKRGGKITKGLIRPGKLRNKLAADFANLLLKANMASELAETSLDEKTQKFLLNDLEKILEYKSDSTDQEDLFEDTDTLEED